jgi:hypothetical protein
MLTALPLGFAARKALEASSTVELKVQALELEMQDDHDHSDTGARTRTHTTHHTHLMHELSLDEHRRYIECGCYLSHFCDSQTSALQHCKSNISR